MNEHCILIKNVHIYLEDRTIEHGYLLIENGLIKAVKSISPPEKQHATVIDGAGLNAIPGFIDGHVHGANGADVMDATTEALDTMASTLPKEGTTSFLATTITQSTDRINQALENVTTYKGKTGHAEIIGVHLEGPFIAKEKAGAQPIQHIKTPSLDQFQQFQEKADGWIKTITMAPELDPKGSFIKSLSQAGINISTGHTNAGFDDMQTATSYGVKQLTHLCNAMNGIHHRDIGSVGAAFQSKSLKAELIADKIHVSEEMLQLIYENVGSNRLLLITDAMRAKCLPSGTYDLGGQRVILDQDKAMLSDGTLAGSVLKMIDGVQNMKQITDATMQEIIEMSAVNPAKQIGIFSRKGSIKEGKDADLLLVDDQLNLKYTFCRGEIAYME